jgi:glycosyltransferase involved in cell wall biosynthesis
MQKDISIKKKIKILVDAHIFDHSYQGTATYIKGLYNALVKNDNLEIVLCACDIDNLKTHFPDPKFKFIKLKTNSKFKRLAIEYPQIIKRGNFDFAHFQYIVPLFKSCKIINTIHDLLFLEYPQYFPWSYRFTKGILFKYSAKKSDLILTVSDYSKKSLIKYFNLKPKDVIVTPNAITNATLNKPKDINEGNYILYVSRFEPRKNHIALLKAYLNLKLYEKGYNLVFIGSKKEKIEIEAFDNLYSSIPSKIKQFVFFFEKINDEELNYYYSQAAAFVFPSLAEGFGIPPLEAAINNCKVLCSNTTAMDDFNFFKYRFDPNDPIEFESKLDQLLSDNDYPYQEIKENIQSKYNWDIIAENYYKKLKNTITIK